MNNNDSCCCINITIRRLNYAAEEITFSTVAEILPVGEYIAAVPNTAVELLSVRDRIATVSTAVAGTSSTGVFSISNTSCVNTVAAEILPGKTRLTAVPTQQQLQYQQRGGKSCDNTAGRRATAALTQQQPKYCTTREELG